MGSLLSVIVGSYARCSYCGISRSYHASSKPPSHRGYAPWTAATAPSRRTAGLTSSASSPKNRWMQGPPLLPADNFLAPIRAKKINEVTEKSKLLFLSLSLYIYIFFNSKNFLKILECNFFFFRKRKFYILPINKLPIETLTDQIP